jgi:TetR/AcrR family transcriptional repressor of nem operon
VPRDGTSTRNRILDAAETLMEGNGVAGTSVHQILEAARTSKGAFFHHFDSKRQLAAALMERYVEADLGHLRAGLAAVEAVTNPVERALGFARYFERWAEELLGEDSACLYIGARPAGGAGA